MRAAIVCMVGMALTGPAAHAQEVPRAQEGARVWVTTTDGLEREGSVASISPTGLVLRVDSTSLAIALADVRRIEGRDSLRNGIRNGGIVGAAAFAGFGLYLSHALCEVSEGCLRNDVGAIARIAGLGAGVGIAAGAAIDYAIKGRRLLYSSSGSSIALEVRPRVITHSVGAEIRMRW